ncbi:TonB-dependent siderophore receptor [Echinimonas agarilytica]|uniref:TonB-dependent receptor n=1 Tax=Echinimonas agarilytica TaxID=1215918 RepID=A0AA41W887_9GAMM|nr:TonB-dependent receptor [Echinimonas agarilytica]MCM2680226.1 TonB-dependent receptor [Echinimonas agarilytica]
MLEQKPFRMTKLAFLVGLSFAASPLTLMAQETEETTAAQEEVVELETYTAEGQVEDSMGIMPTEPVKSVFGFGKTILETPRGVTSVSADMMENYNITDIDDLVLVSPGAFTQSFFGVAGSLDVRGTPGEVYFRGVRRVNNPGNYPTPIGATDRIDIVRGPASPIYGPSKIGGYLNFQPKSARAETGQYLEKPKGGMSYTTGTWDKSILTAEVGGPAEVGGKSLGYYIYAEVENSDSYYENTSTDNTIVQASFNMDLTPSTRIEFGGMHHDFDGNQVAGWNRVTQDLIDHGTYITGKAQSIDTDGDGYNSTSEFLDWQGSFSEDSNNFWVPASSGTDAAMDPLWALEDVGTAKLKGDQVLVAPEDRLETEVNTLYFDIIHEFDSGLTMTNKFFYEELENINENAYGFSQFADTFVVEDQLIFAYETDHNDWLSGAYQVSPSIRYTDFKHGDDFFFEYFDRRDLTGPSTALDRKLHATVADEGYSSYTVGDFTDYGLAFLADFSIYENLNLLLGARYDYVDMSSTEKVSKTAFASPTDPDEKADDSDDGVSWTASISYTTPWGITPYATVSEQTTIIMGQGSEISVGNIEEGNALADSELTELGVKASLLDDRLYMSAAYFKQERTSVNAQDQVSNNTTESEGYEFEARFLATEQFTVTGAWTHIEVTNLTAKDSGTQFGFQGAEDMTGISDPSLFYGYVQQGLYLVNSDSDARKAGIPENMYSLTGAYDFQNGFNANASAVHAESTYSGFSKSVKLPSYTVLNAGVSYSTDDWTIRVQGKNLTDEEYFRSNFPDLFGSTIVLPELPRHWSATASYRF